MIRSTPRNNLIPFCTLCKYLSAVPEYQFHSKVNVACYILSGLHNLFSTLVIISFFVVNHPVMPRLLQISLVGWISFLFTIWLAYYSNIVIGVHNIFLLSDFHYIQISLFEYSIFVYYEYVFVYWLYIIAVCIYVNKDRFDINLDYFLIYYYRLIWILLQ